MKEKKLPVDAETERAVQQALQESEEKFRTIFDRASDGLLIADATTKTFLDGNTTICSMLGYTKEEIETLTIYDIHPSKDIAHVLDAFEKQAKGEITLAEDLPVLRKDGSVFYADISSAPAIIGGAHCILGIFRDITARKQAEEDRKAHIRFLESLERVDQAIKQETDVEQMLRHILETVFSLFDCDRAWLFYPCDPDTPTFRVPMEIYRPEYPGAKVLNVDVPMSPDMAQNLREVLASDDPVIYIAGTERPINRASAEQFGVKSMMMVALYPKLGKPWVFGLHQCSYPRVWTLEEKRLFQEIGRRLTDGLSALLMFRNLQESETKYRRIVDTANEGVWMLGPDTMTTFVNVRMAEMIGYSCEEMSGRPITDFMFEEDAPDHHKKMENRRLGLAEHYERRYRHKNGQTVWTIASSVPILDDARNFQGSFGMFTDITERKRAEESLRKRNEELERFEQAAIGRELKMIELKKRIAELEEEHRN